MGRPQEDHHSLLRSARVVSLATLCSRILGFARDIVMGAFLATWARDALLLAWTIPNIFRRLLGEGALSSALIPSFARLRKEKGDQPALAMGMGVLRSLAFILIGLLLIVYAVTYFLPESFWGWMFSNAKEVSGEEKAYLSRDLLWIFLPYLFLVCLLAQISGVLNSLGRFFIPAIVPAVLNLVWILGVLAVGLSGLEPAAMAIGLAWIILLVGGFMQLGLGWFDLKRNVVVPKPSPFSDPDVKGVFALMAPLLIGLAASQINVLIDRGIAIKGIDRDGAVSNLYYGLRITQLPLGLISIAVSTAAFPRFSRLAAEGKFEALGGSLFASMRTALFLAIPAACGAFVLADPIFEGLFERGEFTPEDSMHSASSLKGYAVGIPFLTATMLLVKAAYSTQRYKLAVWVTLVSVTVNICLDLVLVGPYQELGISLASSMSAAVHAFLLIPIYAAYNRRAALDCLKEVLTTGVLSVGMAVLCYGLLMWIPWGEGRLLVFAKLLLAIAVGVAFFFVAARKFVPERFEELVALVGKKRRRS